MFHLTGARHALQYDEVDDDTVRALQRAEHLGAKRWPISAALSGCSTPTPALSHQNPDRRHLQPRRGFQSCGMNVTFDVSGSLDDVSAAAGLAMYRIAQESLANIAKHAPGAASRMSLTTSCSAARLNVVNELPGGGDDRAVTYGRGLLGMKQRIELLGGTIDIGPGCDGWSVEARVPSGAHEAEMPTRMRAS